MRSDPAKYIIFWLTAIVVYFSVLVQIRQEKIRDLESQVSCLKAPHGASSIAGVIVIITSSLLNQQQGRMLMYPSFLYPIIGLFSIIAGVIVGLLPMFITAGVMYLFTDVNWKYAVAAEPATFLGILLVWLLYIVGEAVCDG